MDDGLYDLGVITRPRSILLLRGLEPAVDFLAVYHAQKSAIPHAFINSICSVSNDEALAKRRWHYTCMAPTGYEASVEILSCEHDKVENVTHKTVPDIDSRFRVDRDLLPIFIAWAFGPQALVPRRI